jgi:hypothetical protein
MVVTRWHLAVRVGPERGSNVTSLDVELSRAVAHRMEEQTERRHSWALRGMMMATWVLLWASVGVALAR